MYKKNRIQSTGINQNNSVEGTSIEEKIERLLNNKEPITDQAQLIYTERNEGVLPSYDIRTDRFEIAVEGMDKVAKSYQARREERMHVVKDDEATEDGGAETTQDTK